MNRIGLYAVVFLTFFWGCASIVENTTSEKEFSLSSGGLWNITFLEPYQNLPKNGKLSFSEKDGALSGMLEYAGAEKPLKEVEIGNDGSISASFTHRGYNFAIEALSAGETIEGRMVGPVTLIFEGIKAEP